MASPDYELMFQRLTAGLGTRLNADELTLVGNAYEVAREAHAGQMRDEGSPYIVHPVRVAATLVDELDIYDPRLVCSALLHDVIEDSPITREQLAVVFGQEIAEVVWLLTKGDSVSLADYLAAIEAAAETGAPLVKLCDRLDNLRFLTDSPRLGKINRYIRTTETYYLPMAARTSRYLLGELERSLNKVRAFVQSLDDA